MPRTNKIESKYNRDNGGDAVTEHLTRAQLALSSLKEGKRENLYSITKIILIYVSMIIIINKERKTNMIMFFYFPFNSNYVCIYRYGYPP